MSKPSQQDGTHEEHDMDIGDSIIAALVDLGVRNVYGVPGDYVLGLFDRVQRCSALNLVCTAGEEGAGFAADADARMTGGIGVCLVTYGVGALKVLNPVSGAYAERSMVLVISGAPGIEEAERHHLLHHTVHHRSRDTQLRMFAEVCAETAQLNSHRTAIQQIKKVLHTMMTYNRPGYLKVPRDRLTRSLPWTMPSFERPVVKLIDEMISPLQSRLALSVLTWLRGCDRPVVLAGLELQRFGLQDIFLSVVEREGWPVATSLTGKTLICERHPLSLGVYDGGMSNPTVRKQVEESDGLLLLGFPFFDLDTGCFTSHFNWKDTARVDLEKGLRWNTGEDSELIDPAVLLKAWVDDSDPPLSPKVQCKEKAHTGPMSFEPKDKTAITVRRLSQSIGAVLHEYCILLADPGDALFSSLDIVLPAMNQFLTNGFWASLGCALPSVIGAWFAALDKKRKPICLVGDGAFLMCAMELATLARYSIPATVVVFDNKGYGTERPMLDGPYNDVQPVDHVALALSVGCKAARRVATEEELWDGLSTFMLESSGPTLLSVSLDRRDCSDALKNLTSALRMEV